MKNIPAKILSVVLVLGFVASALARDSDDGVLLHQLSSTPTKTASTVPANGDQNPYGVAFVPQDFAGGGTIHPGDILVSNFNNSGNAMNPGGLQGTGTTIVSINPGGHQSLFFQGSGLGLTTALGVLRRGVVLVGNLPTDNGVLNPAEAGSLIAIDRNGREIASFTDSNTNSTLFDGPWDLTLIDLDDVAIVFLSDVQNGTVVRLVFAISGDGQHITLKNGAVIGMSYTVAPNMAALIVGPTGLAYDAKNDELFVASTGDNAIYSIPNASKRTMPVTLGTLVYQDSAHLFGPLGLLFAPNGDLITSNGDAVNTMNEPSLLVEFTRTGQFVAEFTLDTTQGAGFGIALHEQDDHVTFAAVDDATNQLKIWDVKEH